MIVMESVVKKKNTGRQQIKCAIDGSYIEYAWSKIKIATLTK